FGPSAFQAPSKPPQPIVSGRFHIVFRLTCSLSFRPLTTMTYTGSRNMHSAKVRTASENHGRRRLPVTGFMPSVAEDAEVAAILLLLTAQTIDQVRDNHQRGQDEHDNGCGGSKVVARGPEHRLKHEDSGHIRGEPRP